MRAPNFNLNQKPLNKPRSPVDIIILAKAPFPGFAKTRLIPLLGPIKSSEAHLQLVKQSLAVANASNLGQCLLYVSHPHPKLLRLSKRFKASIHLQSTGDLGARMLCALRQQSKATLLIGTDCPSLTPNLLCQCAKALSENDCVILPAEDGGYGLIGFAQPRAKAIASLFKDVPWSQTNLMDETRKRATDAQLSLAELAYVWDVDEPADYQRWQALNAEN